MLAVFPAALSLLPAEAAPEGKKKPALTPSGKIDQLVVKGLRANGLEPNPIASDEVFVRRAYLDLTGRIPTRKEATSFIDSKNPAKRSKLVDSLIGSDGYVSHQYNYWADLLRAKTAVAGNNQSIPAGLAYERWIKNAIRENRPYNEMVYELVTATGSSWENPAVGYYLRDYGMPLDNLAITTQVFLGTQIVCAQCHDHPFDEWTQMDYYHLSAFTYPLVTTNNHPLQKKAVELLESRKGKVSKARQTELRKAFSEILFPVRFNNVVETTRKLKLPHDYQYDDAKPKSVVKAATIMGNEAIVSPSTSTVDAFGEWLTSEENPRFTQVIANRMWKRAFGVGLIEPVDDIKEYSKPSNPELMAYLEKLMVDLEYDLQAFQRSIYQTKTYQREASLKVPTPGAPYHFAGPILRRMSAEQIWDSMVALTVENPDEPSAGRELLTERRLKTVELVAESLYDQSPAEFLRNGQEIAKVQKQLAAEIEDAQQKVQEARETQDPELIKTASEEARSIRQKLYSIVEEKVYREELEAKLADLEKASLEENDGSDALLAGLAETVSEEGAIKSGAESMSMSMSGKGRTGGVIEELVDNILAGETAELARKRKVQQNRHAKIWKIDTKDEKKAYRSFMKNSRKMQRASEINSPAPPSHFLREFGQSDRELVENSSDEASVTQALAMLNGPVLNAVTNRYSVLTREMKGEQFSDRLDTIYLSMLSRLPTPSERAIFREAWQSDPGTGTVKGIVWTVMNTRQFLFIQ